LEALGVGTLEMLPAFELPTVDMPLADTDPGGSPCCWCCAPPWDGIVVFVGVTYRLRVVGGGMSDTSSKGLTGTTVGNVSAGPG
jgi:hypothetical protein